MTQSQNNNFTYNALAFIPITGILGFHDLYIKKYKEFTLHIIISIVAIILNIVVPKLVMDYLFSISTKSYIMAPNDPIYIFFCVRLPILIFIGLYVWGIIENRNYKKAQNIQSTGLAMPNTISPVEGDIKADKTEIMVDNDSNNKHFSFISFCLSLIPLFVWLYTLISIVQNIDEIKSPGYSGGMAVMWLPLFYYGTAGIGFVISFFSIRFAILSLKIKEHHRLAITSLVLKAITIAIIIAVYVVLS